MELAEWLYKKRKSYDYSQEFVAQHLHVTQQWLSQWENGIGYPNFSMLKKIFQFYNCTSEEISELFFDIHNDL